MAPRRDSPTLDGNHMLARSTLAYRVYDANEDNIPHNDADTDCFIDSNKMLCWYRLGHATKAPLYSERNNFLEVVRDYKVSTSFNWIV